MNYVQSLEFIESLPRSPDDLALTRMKAFCHDYGDLQNTFPSLHVGGTNGKGSTVAILDSVLKSSGAKVGRFTGPHLLKWNERFHVGGQAIDDQLFAHYATEITEQSKKFAQLHRDLGPLTWFEFLTAMAFLIFAESKVDVAVFEVGLGGRFDATNVLAKPLAIGITNVSYDHTEILGKTIEQIAFEKAGIIKENVPLVTAAQSPALDVIAERAKILNAPVLSLPGANLKRNHALAAVDLDGLNIAAALSLLGRHQLTNAEMALQMLNVAGLIDFGNGASGGDHQIIEKGLSTVYWPGRLQIIEIAERKIILDGAHNEASSIALRASLDEFFAEQHLSFVFACYANKNGPAILKNLLCPGDRLYVSEAQVRRETFQPGILADQAERLGIATSCYQSIALALGAALSDKNDAQPVVVTGSFATVKEVMVSLGWNCVEDGLHT